MVMVRKSLRIASRGSRLALWQANSVRDKVAGAYPGLLVEVEVVRTTGDKILDVPLARIGDKGLFTKEIDEALLADRADIAVHSLKDVPTRLPEGLAIAAVTLREDPRDVLIVRDGVPGRLEDLPAGSRVGTSSLRRRAQLSHLRSDLEVVDLRGNLDTRFDRLDAGHYEAIILAAAGVSRLGLGDRISQTLSPPGWLPAVGQGALAIVARTSDAAVSDLLEPLHDPTTAACTAAERAFLRSLEGGCQVPIGALATIIHGSLTIDGFVSDLDGVELLRDGQTGEPDDAENVGRRLAHALNVRGAANILAEVRRRSGSHSVPAP
jgi:hydroxymethylbilane synthase